MGLQVQFSILVRADARCISSPLLNVKLRNKTAEGSEDLDIRGGYLSYRGDQFPSALLAVSGVYACHAILVDAIVVFLSNMYILMQQGIEDFVQDQSVT